MFPTRDIPKLEPTFYISYSAQPATFAEFGKPVYS